MKSICRLALFAAFLCCAPSQAQFSFRQWSADSLELSDGGKPVFVYNHGPILREGFPETMRRSTYLHPVYAPGGTVLTDDFNPDHPHHRGISWMWPVVVVEGKTYDLWTVGGIRQKFERWLARETQGRTALLEAENGWYVGDRKVVDERVSIRVHHLVTNVRVLDFALSFQAAGGPVDIAGTPDQKKGFGGFCFRFAPRDGGVKGTVIRTDKGIKEGDGVLSVHRWAQVEGVFKGERAGGRIIDDVANPGYPNGWLLRYGFGFLNVSWPGLKTHRLERNRPLELRYRVLLFSGAQPEAQF